MFAEGNVGCMTAGCPNDLLAYLVLKNLEAVPQTAHVEWTDDDGTIIKKTYMLSPNERKPVDVKNDAYPTRAANFATVVRFERMGSAALVMRSLARFFDPDAAMLAEGKTVCPGY